MEYEEEAKDLEHQVEDMEQESEKLEEEIKDAKGDWDSKQHDDRVPGAVPDDQYEDAEDDDGG